MPAGQLLGRWVAIERSEAVGSPGVLGEQRAELARLRVENAAWAAREAAEPSPLSSGGTSSRLRSSTSTRSPTGSRVAADLADLRDDGCHPPSANTQSPGERALEHVLLLRQNGCSASGLRDWQELQE